MKNYREIAGIRNVEVFPPGKDGTQKCRVELIDGAFIETVVLPRNLKQRQRQKYWSQAQGPEIESHRVTVCVSSQVGCAMACDFCATGKMGWKRHLSSYEILAQVQIAQSVVAPRREITNVVFMGMGEPLHAFDAVTGAIAILRESRPYGFGMSKRKILVSTSGIAQKLPELAQKSGVRLALSLNATTDALRDQVMPINRSVPMDRLIAAGRDYAEKTKSTVMLEMVLFADLNDRLEDADRLIEWARGWNCKVNLIPYNAFALGPYRRPDVDRVKAYQHRLIQSGITATVRYSGGDDVEAACGQLNPALLSQRISFQLSKEINSSV